MHTIVWGWAWIILLLPMFQRADHTTQFRLIKRCVRWCGAAVNIIPAMALILIIICIFPLIDGDSIAKFHENICHFRWSPCPPSCTRQIFRRWFFGILGSCVWRGCLCLFQSLGRLNDRHLSSPFMETASKERARYSTLQNEATTVQDLRPCLLLAPMQCTIW